MTTLNFRVNFWTNQGQSIVILAHGDVLDNSVEPKSVFGNKYTLNWTGEGNWEGSIKLPDNVFLDKEGNKTITYKYAILEGEDKFQLEKGDDRTLNLEDFRSFRGSTLLIQDRWRSPFTLDRIPRLNASIFTDVVYRRKKDPQGTLSGLKPLSSCVAIQSEVRVRIQVHNVFVPNDCDVYITGSGALGNWNTQTANKASDADYPSWKFDLTVPASDFPLTYKYFIRSRTNPEQITWENGSDRHLTLCNPTPAFINLEEDYNISDNFRGAGVVLPIFSLRSQQSVGIGEFSDLPLLMDWASACGIKLVQILPVNDTLVKGNFQDSYPYNSLSVFALNPVYIRLQTLTDDQAIKKEIETERQKLDIRKGEDEFQNVVNFKFKILRKIFEKEKSKFQNNSDFKSWFVQNEKWLAPYALYVVFKKEFGTYDFDQWKDYKTITKEQIKELTSPKSKYYEELCFHYYVQFQLHQQLHSASNYGESIGVGLKGDIAIGVSPKSVDTWVEPHLFRLSKSTGAPPDFFAEDGQNWGFPTYDWEAMSKDNFSWWRARLTQMSYYFHAFRIDHILGFFRIWEIPREHVTGMYGRFNPSVPLHANELRENGIWDFERLVRPYVRHHLLERLFYEKANEMAAKYFNHTGHGFYEFKAEYNSEKKIAAATPTNGVTSVEASHNAWVRKGLYTLMQNVVLLRDDNNWDHYYPRIEMFKSTSYAELYPHEKEALYRLYVEYFYRRQEGLWAQVALHRLPIMINSTKMLCCGEDLGMVPECCPTVMNQLQLLGLRIQRMPADSKIEFMHPGDYPYLTVAAPSSHDTSTLRGWWEEDYNSSQRFWNTILGEWGPAPKHCDEVVARKIFDQHIHSPSMWAVFPLQDWFALSSKYTENRDPSQERINVPSNPEHYWSYRIHVTLEELNADKHFIITIKDLLKKSNRI